jgi:acetoin utilization protein AcuB
MGMKVSEIMTRDVATVKRTSLAGEAFEAMRKGHFRHLAVVEENGDLCGVLSDRDIRNVTILFDRNPDEQDDYMIFGPVKVEDLMVPDPVTLQVDDTIDRALAFIKSGRLSCLPVLGDGKLVGIITTSDLLNLLKRLLKSG